MRNFIIIMRMDGDHEIAVILIICCDFSLTHRCLDIIIAEASVE